MLAPGVELGGGQVGAVVPGTGSEEACAATCRDSAACGWFNWCQSVEGCTLSGGNASLAYEACQLLSGNCTLVPPLVARFTNVTSVEGRQQALVRRQQRQGRRHPSTAARHALPDVPPPLPAPPHPTPPPTAGFPLRTATPLSLPGYVVIQGQGIEGGDFECEASTAPGQCSYSQVLPALTACSGKLDAQCAAVVVFANGTDGCGAQVAVLKSAGLAPANTLFGPSSKEGEGGGRGLYPQNLPLPPPNSSAATAPAAALHLDLTVRHPPPPPPPPTLTPTTTHPPLVHTPTLACSVRARSSGFGGRGLLALQRGGGCAGSRRRRLGSKRHGRQQGVAGLHHCRRACNC